MKLDRATILERTTHWRLRASREQAKRTRGEQDAAASERAQAAIPRGQPRLHSLSWRAGGPRSITQQPFLASLRLAGVPAVRPAAAPATVPDTSANVLDRRSSSS